MAQSLNNNLLIKDLVETGTALIDLINHSHVAKDQELLTAEVKDAVKEHTEMKELVKQMLNELSVSEQNVSQKLLDMEDKRTQDLQKLENLDEELRKVTERSQNKDSEIQFLQRELEKMKESEKEIQMLEQEVEEGTTEIIPEARHIARLYHNITKIKWEYETEPNILKGVHYGADLATPINIDTSKVSPREVSNQLWALMSTEW